jgi:hypothetical protein
MDAVTFALIVATIALGVLTVQLISAPSRNLPPGPKGHPIIGNLLDLPKHEAHLAWHEMGKKYGPLTFLKVFNRPVLVLNSHEATKELLVRRGAIYSERPALTMFSDLVGKN